MAAFLVLSAPLVPLEKRRDGKKIGEKNLRDKKLGYLMPALFLRYFDQQKGSLTLPRSIAGTDRSRYISKAGHCGSADRSR